MRRSICRSFILTYYDGFVYITAAIVSILLTLLTWCRGARQDSTRHTQHHSPASWGPGIENNVFSMTAAHKHHCTNVCRYNLYLLLNKNIFCPLLNTISNFVHSHSDQKKNSPRNFFLIILLNNESVYKYSFTLSNLAVIPQFWSTHLWSDEVGRVTWRHQ